MTNLFSKHEGWLIAVITVFFYTSTYFFERGASIELKIPLDFIAIGIPTIANDVMSFSILLFPIILTSILLHHYSSNNVDSWINKSSLFIYTLIYFIPMYFYSKDWDSYPLHLLFGFFYANIICERYKFNVNGFAGKFVINASMALLVLSFTFISLGKVSADPTNFTKHTTFSLKGKTYVIIKIYDENVFSWPIENDKIIKNLTHFRVSDMSGVELKESKFGEKN